KDSFIDGGVAEERDHDQVAQDWDGNCCDDELAQRTAAGDTCEEQTDEWTPGQPEGPEEQRVAGHPLRAIELIAHGFRHALRQRPEEAADVFYQAIKP